jgi:hypothetical protein
MSGQNQEALRTLSLLRQSVVLRSTRAAEGFRAYARG